jgi:hypothetical protein
MKRALAALAVVAAGCSSAPSGPSAPGGPGPSSAATETWAFRVTGIAGQPGVITAD